jgi:hypothetical protein
MVSSHVSQLLFEPEQPFQRLRRSPGQLSRFNIAYITYYSQYL